MAYDYRKTARAAAGLSEKSAKQLPVAKSNQRKLRVTERIEETRVVAQEAKEIAAAAAPMPDPNTTPLAPTGVAASAFARALAVSWALPLETQYVIRTVVRITRLDTGAIITRTATESVVIAENLELVEYSVEVAHVNRWKRQGPWSTAIKATPTPTVADRITASTKVAAGELSDLLNDPGIKALTDPAKLAESVVRSAALQGTQEPNLLRYDEAEFENYPLGALAGSVNEAGMTTTIVGAPPPKKWLSASRASGATGSTARPFPNYRDRLEGEAAGTFFLSFQARNTGAVAVRVQARAEQSRDAVATASQSQGTIVTVQPGKTETVFVKFVTDATLTSQRFGIVLVDAGQSVLVNRVMLQRAAAAKLEPGPYRTPGFTAGIVSAQLLSAWDIVAGRAILADATINQALMASAAIGDLQIDRGTANKLRVLSADIVSLAVDKMVAGTFRGGQMFLSATGFLSTPGDDTRLDDGGLTLSQTPSYNTPSAGRAQKVSSRDDSGAVAFYNDTGSGYKGVVVRQDGRADGNRGAVVLHATRGGVLESTSTARLEVLSLTDGGQVNAWGKFSSLGDFSSQGEAAMQKSLTVGLDLVVGRDIAVDGIVRGRNNLGFIVETSSVSVSPNGGFVTITHNFTGIPFKYTYQYLESSRWRPLVHGVNSWLIGIDNTNLIITNQATVARSIRGVIER